MNHTTTEARFFSRLESWFNRPSRLYQAEEDIVDEDTPDSADAKEDVVLDGEDMQEWLEERARRTSILHQVLRKLDAGPPTGSSVVHGSPLYKAAICAKLAREYLTTVVKILLWTSATWKDGEQPASTVPARPPLDVQEDLGEILSVSINQVFRQLQAVQQELADRRNNPNDSDNARDVKQTRSLVDQVETVLFTLFDGFTKAGLAELDAGDSSDSSMLDFSDDEEDRSQKPLTSRGKIRGTYRLLPSAPPDHDYRTLGIDSHTNYPPLQLLLFGIINHIIAELARSTSGGVESGLDRAYFMLDIIETTKKGLTGLYHATGASTTRIICDPNSQITYSGERTMNIHCRAAIAWATYNASLIRVSLSLSIYGHQQRMNGPGKTLRRYQTVEGEHIWSRHLPHHPDTHLRKEPLRNSQEPRHDRTLSMSNIEEAWIELLEVASVCTDLSNTRARVEDMMRLIISLWERYVEHQTAIWMTLPAPRPKVADYIDMTKVAKSLRFLTEEAMWRHGLTVGRYIFHSG